MEYRIATTADCEELTYLRMKMRQERDVNFREEELYENTLNFFKRNIENGSHVAFLCEDNGTIVATAGVTLFEMPPTSKLPNGKVAKLMNMYVVPSHRRQGIADTMLRFVADYVSSHGYHKIMLNSSPMGEHLYQKFGFALIPNEYEYFDGLQST